MIEPGTHILQWHITHRCNLRCSHCYQRDFSRELPAEQLCKVLGDYIAFLNGRSLHGQISLTGGEPLLHPAFFDLAEEIRRAGLSFSVLTNGTLLTEETAARLARLGPVFVQVSLDGLRKNHEAIRGKGSFDRALMGIDTAKRHGLTVHVSFTAQHCNYRDLAGLSLLCRLHRVDKLWYDRVVIPKAEDNSRISLIGEEFDSLCRSAGRLAKLRLVSCERALQFQHCPGAKVYHCGAGGDLLVLLADGSVMPCRRLPFVIGNIREHSIEEIISESPLMQELREAPLPDGCKICTKKELCRGGARCIALAQLSSWKEKDPGCRFRQP
ncbi:MAG: radical SAM protein [Lachnospiraceae bacterium]|nr:radical SAM protein [Lachnospiraceae bacterium]